MARRFSRSVPALRQGQRRLTSWVASPNITAVQNLAANSVILQGSGNAALLAARPFTIVRTRGSFWVKSDQVAATRTPFGALGFSVVSDAAVAIGITALPLPITDEASELFFTFQFWLADFTFVTAAGVDGSQGMARYDFDSKAMRKVNLGSDIAVTVQNAAVAGGVNFVMKYRLLIKQH